MGARQDAYISKGWARGEIDPHLLAAAVASPRSRLLLLADLAVRRRNASSLYVWDSSEVLHLEHKDEPREGDVETDDHATALPAATRTTTSSRLPLHLRV